MRTRLPLPLRSTSRRKPACGEEGERQVGPQRLLPALERKLPSRDILLGPDAGNRNADVEATERLAARREHPISAFLARKIALNGNRVRELGRQRLRPLLTVVVVEREAGSSAAKARPQAAPMPPDEPVTRTRLPSRPVSIR